VRRLALGEPPLADLPDLTAGDTPAHLRIEQWLGRQITSGGLRPGDRLPSEVEAAHALGVSRMTLRQALASLEGKGLLVRRRGRGGGSFVAEPRLEVELSGLPGLTEQMRRAHVRAGARVLRAATVAAPADVRLALDLPPGQPVHEIVRIRTANREPVALEESYYPAALYPDLLGRRLTGSIYALLRGYGRAPWSATEELEPVKATAEQAGLLDVEVDAPLLRVTRTACSTDGVPVEHARDHFRADRTRITLRTQADAGARTEVQPRDARPHETRRPSA
jgi:GntR family transcriptional regulator